MLTYAESIAFMRQSQFTSKEKRTDAELEKVLEVLLEEL